MAPATKPSPFLTNKYVNGKRVRHKGDSAFLGKLRYEKKKVPAIISFKEWKKNREAQHIIPWSIGAKFRLSDKFLNSAENGMMLPSGRNGSKKQGSAAYLKHKQTTIKLNKIIRTKRASFHIFQGLAHPKYNKYVEQEILKIKNKGGNLLAGVRVFAKKLRRVCKNGSLKYIDDIL